MRNLICRKGKELAWCHQGRGKICTSLAWIQSWDRHSTTTLLCWLLYSFFFLLSYFSFLKILFHYLDSFIPHEYKAQIYKLSLRTVIALSWIAVPRSLAALACNTAMVCHLPSPCYFCPLYLLVPNLLTYLLSVVYPLPLECKCHKGSGWSALFILGPSA